MTNEQALKLHNGDEVLVKETNTVARVLDAYAEDDGTVTIETTHKGYAILYPDEIE